MEKFAIRFETQKFLDVVSEVRDCAAQVDFNNFDVGIAVKAEQLRYLAQLCREQSLTVIGTVAPYRELIKNANYIDALIQAALIDKHSETTYDIAERLTLELTSFLDALVMKFGGVTSEGREVVKSSYNSSTGNFGQPDNVEGIENNLKDLNTVLAQELLEITAKAPNSSNVAVEVRGSVAIHHFFKNLKLKHSVVRFSGIKYSSGNKSEITTPLTVLHNQKLFMVKLKAQKFHFRRSILTEKERNQRKLEIIQNIKQTNFIDTDIDMKDYVSGGVLMSSFFKGYSFIWVSNREELTQLEHIPENKAYLMWSRNENG